MDRIAICAAVAAAAVFPASASAAGDPLRPQQWGLDLMHVDAAHRVTEGAGVTVAIVDTGVDASHPDLAGSVIPGPDLVTGDGDPRDENGHGTAVAGVVGAHEGNGIGIEGVAPASKLLAIRVLAANGSGNTGTAAAGIDAAVARGAQVINLSLGSGPTVTQVLLPDDRLTQAIERAAAAGVVIVAAAGNDALPLCEQPVVRQRILCVGAVGRSDTRSSYSNFGLRVDVVAPGGDRDGPIVTTVAGGGYEGWTGTSFATPMVSGVAALLVSLGLHGPQVIDRLEATARDIGSPGTDLVYGRGLIDAGAAVAGLGPVARPAGVADVFARAPGTQKISALLRRGLAVRCGASVATSCTAALTTTLGKVLARGSRLVAPGLPATVRLRATRAGRRELGRARRLRTVLRIDAQGTALTRSVLLVR
ncbi:MAG: Proprotein convertase in/kexin type 6 [Solirubrobacterales bacterium]|nr:Proprotein convertase in/kexin type 6 [Solirubrobacterales bacterium]